jgi:hypothetical protein
VCRPIEEIIFPQNQAFDVCQNFLGKTKAQKFCKLQTNLVSRLASRIVSPRLGLGLIGAMADFTTKLTNKLLRHDAS